MTTTDPSPGQAVFDPRGRLEVERRAPAARATRLEGLRLGVLDNSKWNAGKLLRAAVARFATGTALGEVTYYRKESFSKAADPALIDKIAAHSDVVLTAIGD